MYYLYCMVFRKTFLILVAAFLMTATLTTPLLASTPGQLIVQSIEEGLAILRDPALRGEDKTIERREKLWEALKEIFNFKETSKRSLGRHWLKLTTEEQNEFTENFQHVLKDLYLGKSDAYQGENIVYIREIVKGKRGKVQTNFFTADNKKIIVDFSMHKVDDKTWKVYDVIIEGVSMISNYRSQFNSILAKSSFDELLEQIIEKRKSIKKSVKKSKQEPNKLSKNTGE